MKNILLILILIFILFIFISKVINLKEHYCKVPPKNKIGTDNYFNVDIDFKPQSNIFNSNCDKYWKQYSKEYNSDLILDEPIPIPGNQLKLPVEAGTGNSTYKYGLIDFNKLSSLINDNNVDKKLYDKSIKLSINPINNESVKNINEVSFFIEKLNKKTNIKRFNEYNPTKTNYFKTIISPIKEINTLNIDFLKRINNKQVNIMSQKDKLYNGKMEYQIYNYKIIDIKYINSNSKKPIFVIIVNLFQEYNYYINSFSYIGYIDNENKVRIFNCEFIGVYPSAQFLNTSGYDEKLPTNYYILNKNFNDFQPRMNDINKVVKIIDNKKKLNSLESNYACFNTDINSPNKILKHDTKTLCESNIDQYGRPKPVGIFDKPCEKDEECPFYKSNKNYKNNFGGCINGKCMLPLNMKNIGYHYYSYNKNYNPLCYNCDNKEFDLLSNKLNDCCKDQFDKNKYKELKSPDYAYKNDIINRINVYNQKNYKKKQLV